jgi:hypothetical protein
VTTQLKLPHAAAKHTLCSRIFNKTYDPNEDLHPYESYVLRVLHTCTFKNKQLHYIYLRTQWCQNRVHVFVRSQAFVTKFVFLAILHRLQTTTTTTTIIITTAYRTLNNSLYILSFLLCLIHTYPVSGLRMFTYLNVYILTFLHFTYFTFYMHKITSLLGALLTHTTTNRCKSNEFFLTSQMQSFYSLFLKYDRPDNGLIKNKPAETCGHFE